MRSDSCWAHCLTRSGFTGCVGAGVHSERARNHCSLWPPWVGLVIGDDQGDLIGWQQFQRAVAVVQFDDRHGLP